MNKRDDFEITNLDKENGYDDFELDENGNSRNSPKPDNSTEQKPVKNRKKSGVLSNILIALAAICMVGAAAILIIGTMEDRQAKESIHREETDALTESTETALAVQQKPEETVPEEAGTQPAETVSGEAGTQPAETVPEETDMQPEEPDGTAEQPKTGNPYEEYFQKNTDMAAWLVVPGTNIDYPVMQTPADENYYLYLDFDKKKNKNGSLILDTDSSIDPIGTNLIIHGHNMKSGAMFGNLQEYEDKEYYEDHKTMILYTEECRRNYEVIAVFYTQVYKKTDNVFKFYKFFQADTEEEFLDYYDNIKALSLYDTGVTAEFGDRFLTLSTCSYQVENGRFVVVAKEVGTGEYYEEVLTKR